MEPMLYGPYLLLERLGTGGSGDAFLARSIDPARNIPAPIVLKRLHPDLVESEHFVQRFLHEAEIALTTDNPHVARIYDVGAAEGTFYMAIEFVPGWTLTSMLTLLVDTKRSVPIPLAARLMTQALIGLDALHSAKSDDGVPLEFIHRDIAPKNIMLGDDGIVRIIDLGLGKSRVQEWKTETGSLLGSVGYMSPEQIQGRPLDRRTDIFSMGVVFWELLTVKRYVRYGAVLEMVHDALKKRYTPPSTERPEIPRELDELLARAMAPNPRDRFSTAAEFLEALIHTIPPQASYEEIRKFLGSLYGRRIVERRRHIDGLLARQKPDDAKTKPDAVIIGTRSGVERRSESEAETTPSGRAADDDPSEVDTFDSDRTGKMMAIPPGDTQPVNIPARDSVQEVVRKAMQVRSRLPTNSERRQQITEALAYLALARSSEDTSQIAKIKSLRKRLEDLVG